MLENRWEHFSHEADMGVRGFGATREDAFAQTALALTAVICNPDLIRPENEIVIDCSAPDSELLLVDWLNALIYEMDTRKMLFSRFQVEIEGGRLHGKAWGEPVVVADHQPVVEVKGASYSELSVGQNPGGGWYAQCVVDV
jgi:tRNA nucleotidyltransferase (CCA-adding enzyme)